MREVVIRVTGAAGERVEVQVTERAGAVRVHVRSADVDLTTALRHNLGELVRSIAEKGLRIETWTPAETWPALTPVPGSDAAIGVPETFFSGEHTPSNGDQHRHSSEQDGRSQRSPGARLEDSGTADEHRRGRARELWFEEFERRLGRS